MKKYLLKAIVFATTGLLLTSKLAAQDLHFSQYNASPLLLNPALAGMNSGDYRAYANFRTQWVTLSKSNTYRTFAGGADMSIGKITKRNSFAGIGLSFSSDQAGELNLNSNRVDLSVAYHFMLNRKGTMQLSAGLQAGVNIRNINQGKAIYGSQYDPVTGLVDPNGTRETLGKNRIIFADAAVGVLYSAQTRKGTNLYMGVGLSHINQPKISFQPSGIDGENGKAEKLPMKLTVHGGVSIPVNNRVDIMPNFMVLWQGVSYEFNAGCHLKTKLGNVKLSKTAILFGAYYRGLYDAVIVSTRVDIKGVSCGLSYDFNISKLLPATKSVGAPEISLMYQGSFRKKPRPGHCPDMF
ncbi:MAG TPA: PorP/SprF family type IX secretion system membrane protein [Chitinophagales bacterium]|nr:PorP/SprF family type IX secretion system membrane protein [Chitinophagales bacterium]